MTRLMGLIFGVAALLSANVPDAAAQSGWKSFRCGNGDIGQIQFPNAGGTGNVDLGQKITADVAAVHAS